MEEAPQIPTSLRLAAALSWRFLVVAAAIAVIALALAALRIIFLPVIVALLLATALEPPARWLRDRGVPGAIASLGVLLGGLLALAATVALVAGLVALDIDEFQGVRDRVNEGVDRATQWIVDSPLPVPEDELTRRVEQAREELRANAGRIAGGVFSGALIVIEIIAGSVLALVLLFFFVNDGRGMWEWVVRVVSGGHERDLDVIGRRAWGVLTGYLRGTAAVAFADAVLIGLALVVIGVPFAFPLAVLIFFGGFIPIVGAFVTGFLAVMVALAAEGFLSALAVLVAIVVVQQVEGNVLQPLLVGRSVALHPVVVILAVTAGGTIWGIPGAFVAVPLTAVGASVISYAAARGHGAPSEEASDVPIGGEATVAEDAPAAPTGAPDEDAAT